MLFAKKLDLLLDHRLRCLNRGAHELQAFVNDIRDLRRHFKTGLVRKGSALVELPGLDLRLVDGLHHLLGQSLGQRLAHDRVDDVGGNLRPVEVG